MRIAGMWDGSSDQLFEATDWMDHWSRPWNCPVKHPEALLYKTHAPMTFCGLRNLSWWIPKVQLCSKITQPSKCGFGVNNATRPLKPSWQTLPDAAGASWILVVEPHLPRRLNMRLVNWNHHPCYVGKSDAYIEVSWNGGTSKSSILNGFSVVNHPFIGIFHWWTPPYLYIQYLKAPASHSNHPTRLSHSEVASTPSPSALYCHPSLSCWHYMILRFAW